MEESTKATAREATLQATLQQCNVAFLSDISILSKEAPGCELATFQLAANLLYLLSHMPPTHMCFEDPTDQPPTLTLDRRRLRTHTPRAKVSGRKWNRRPISPSHSTRSRYSGRLMSVPYRA